MEYIMKRGIIKNIVRWAMAAIIITTMTFAMVFSNVSVHSGQTIAAEETTETSADPDSRSSDESSDETSEDTSSKQTPSENKTDESKSAPEDPAETEKETKTEQQSLSATIYTDGSYQQKSKTKDQITLTGMMPEKAEVKAYPVSVKIEGAKTIAAYDITIFDQDGNTFEPDRTIQVKIQTEEAMDTEKTIEVQHKENIDSQPESIAITSNSKHDVTFEASQFSIYAVGEHYTDTWIFQDEDGTEVYKEILSSGETPVKPATPEKEGYRFIGWKDESGNILSDDAFSTAIGTLTADETHVYTAAYEKVYHVSYAGAASSDAGIIAVQDYSEGETLNTGTVTFVPAEGYVFKGWSTTTDGSSPVSDSTTVTEDMTLYPIVEKGYWITYHSNGGTAQEPTFVKQSQTPSEGSPADPLSVTPTRKGYTFAGWYKDEALTEEWTSTDNTTTLTGNTNLYAKWEPAETTFQVIIMQENNTSTGYDYVESQSFDAMTDSTITLTQPSGSSSIRMAYTDSNGSQTDTFSNSAYDYFHINTDKTLDSSNSSVTVSGDGSTKIYVYYDRNTYTFEFHLNSYNASMTKDGVTYRDFSYSGGANYYTFTAKYGESITEWPYRGNATFSNSSYGYQWTGWRDANASQYGYAYSQMNRTVVESDMIPNSLMNTDNATITVYGAWDAGASLYYIHFYEDKDDGTQEELTDYYFEAYSTTSGWVAADLRGFTKEDSKTTVSSSRKVSFYYTRNKYTIDFYTADGSSVAHESSVPYDYVVKTSLDDQSDQYYLNPTAPEDDYIFEGWYTSPTFEEGTEFEFDDSYKMPDNNISLYPKWSPPSYTVSFDLNGADGSIDSQTVVKNNTASEPDDPVREGYEFVGWFNEDGSAFSFDTPITADTTLVAHWQSSVTTNIVYDPNGGSPSDTWQSDTSYHLGSQGIVGNMKSGVEPPSGKNDFICWNTKADGTGTNYYPEDLIAVTEENLTLYAVWADQRATQLTFDANGGSYNDSTTQRIVQFPDYTEDSENVPNTEFTITNTYTPERSGYIFKGWATTADADTAEYNVEDVIQADTLDTNILYAVWEPVCSLTVKKVVDGEYGDKNKSFNFTITLKDENGDPVNATYSGMQFVNGQYTAQLKNDQSIKFADIPEGYTYEIQEDDYSSEEYETSSSGDAAQGTLTEKADGTYDYEVIYTNKRDITITGILEDHAGLRVLLVVAVAAVIYGIYRKQKQKITRSDK